MAFPKLTDEGKRSEQIEKRDIYIEIVKAVDSQYRGSGGKEKKYM